MISADVSLLLRRALISEYTIVGPDVGEAAERRLAPTRAPELTDEQKVRDFTRLRARMADLERLMELVGGDDLSRGDDLPLPERRIDARLLVGLVDVAINAAAGDAESSGGGPGPDAILNTARRIEALRALRAELAGDDAPPAEPASAAAAEAPAPTQEARCDRCSAPATYRDVLGRDSYCDDCAAYIGAHRRGEQYGGILALGFAVSLLQDNGVPGERIVAAVHDVLTNPHSDGSYPIGGDVAALGVDYRANHPELTGMTPLERGAA